MQASPGVVTFLFTDIEGSTRLWEREPERMRPALARHDAIAPKLTQILLNSAFNMFPDSPAAAGKKEGETKLSAEQMAFAQLTQGIHW